MKSFQGMDAVERQRVASLIERTKNDKVEDDQAKLDEYGGRKRSRPSDIVAQRRAQQSNGMPAEECTDTIGKLWAWGCLDGTRFSPDLLRDAGRRYAAAYWFRFGPVCGKVGAYSDMGGRSSGPPSVVIADPEKDVLIEERFRRRDDALRAIGRKIKNLVDQVCVDGQGDNDPGWLADLMTGYLAETRKQRANLAVQTLQLGVGNKEQRRKAERRQADTRREIDRMVRALRLERMPALDLALIRDGLCELAEIDKKEGLHRPRRAKKVPEED